MTWTPAIALSYTGGGAAGTSFRVECKGVSGSGDQIRVTLKGPLKCDHLFAGVAASPPSTTAVPVELKIGGVSGCNIPSGQEVTTDWATLAVSTGQTLIVGGDHADDGGAWFSNPPPWESNPGMANCDQWWANGDSWNVASPSGFSENVGLCVAVSGIEAQTISSTELVNIEKMSRAIASSGIDPASEAFDGGTETKWSSLEIGSGVSGIAWIGQDFGVSRDIRKITIEQFAASTAINSVKVQRSDDGTNWTDVGTYAITKDTALNTLELSAGASRYWRLLANANSGDRWQIKRIRFFAPENTVPEIEPLFQAYVKTNPSFTTGIVTQVPMDAQWADSHGDFDPVNHRHTPSRLGWYQYTVQITATGTISRMEVYPRKFYPDGSPQLQPFILPNAPHNGTIIQVVKIPIMNPGEYVDVAALIEGSNVTLEGHKCLFEAHWIGE